LATSSAVYSPVFFSGAPDAAGVAASEVDGFSSFAGAGAGADAGVDDDEEEEASP